jgi:hypothetical protein
MTKATTPPERGAAGEVPLIIQYTNLLHQYRSPDAEEVQVFLRAHQGDSVFLERAEVLNKVFRLKQELVPGPVDS